MKIVKKYLIPNKDNDYKPHILRKSAVSVIAFISLFVFFVGIVHTTVLKKTNFLSAVIPRTLVDLANADRTVNKLAVLTINPLLVEAAQKKANDMAAKSYFAHNSPDGLTPWHWFKDVKYKFLYAGENLAINFTDSLDVNNAWMNSPGHRANILNGKFTEIGIATANGFYNGEETTFVVQMFGKPSESININLQLTTKPAPQSTTVGTSTPTTTPIVASENTDDNLVLGTSIPPVVIEETETFIAVMDTANIEVDSTQTTFASNNSSSDGAPYTAVESDFDNVLANPTRNLTLLYIVIGTIIVFALILMVFIEIRRQHPRNIALGLALLVLIGVLLFVYRTYIFTEVIIL
jgi:hypothetical protein